MVILRTGDFTKLPWKNGLGVSHVIASDPPAAGYDTVNWQVGTTEFGFDCPFSNLAGMDRQFMLLSGGGVELHCIDVVAGVDVRGKVDRPFVPFAFSGDWQTTCRMLGNPVQVFNVMTRRGKATARISIPRWIGALYCEQRAGEVLVGVLLSGIARVSGEAAALAVHEAVMLDAPAGEHCEIVAGMGDTRMAVVHITPA
jgi:environmental stress-induced protein Ves